VGLQSNASHSEICSLAFQHCFSQIFVFEPFLGSVFPLSMSVHVETRVYTTYFPERFICINGSVVLPLVRFPFPHRDTPHTYPLVGSSAATGATVRDLMSSESIAIIWETLRHFFNRAVNDIKTCL